MASRTLELLIKLKIIGDAELAKLKAQLESLNELGGLDVDLGDAKAEIEALKAEIAELSEALENVASGETSGDGGRTPDPVIPELPDQTVNAIKELAQALGVADDEAEDLAKSIGKPASQIDPLLANLRRLEDLDFGVDDQFKAIAKQAGLTREQFEQLRKAADLQDIANEAKILARELNISEKEARELKEELSDAAKQRLSRGVGRRSTPRVEAPSGGRVGGNVFARARAALVEGNPLEKIQSGTKGFAAALGGVASGIFVIQSAYNALKATAQPIYMALIASNEQLNQQILSSAANLASASRVFRDGIEIQDPTERIQSLAPTLKAALKQVEEDTRSLVGVTSTEVNELFQITLTNASAIQNQSEKFADPIAAATSLTKGWAASLKVVGLPLNQSRQEINSILKAQIDNNSVLAKNLGITNQQANQWKAQGKLVDELNKRLEVFVAGNAIAANSIDGVTSNIRDSLEVIGREIGEPLLDPTVAGLLQVDELLQANKEGIIDYFATFSKAGIEAVGPTIEAIKPGVEAILAAIKPLAPIIQDIILMTLAGLPVIAKALSDQLVIIGNILKVATEAIERVTFLLSLRQRGDSEKALESLRNSTELLGEEALRTAERIKALEGLKADGPLTGDQEKELAALQSRAQSLVPALEGQMKAVKGVTAVGKEASVQQKAQIRDLEIFQKVLSNTGGVTIQAKELIELGTTYEQLAEKAKNAKRTVADQGSGDTTLFNKASKELIDITQQQLELGQITETEAKERLSSLAENTKLEVGLQRSAAQTLEKIRKQQVQVTKTTTDAEIAVLEARATQGGEQQIQALQEIGVKREMLLDEQLESLKGAIAAEKEAIEDGRGSEKQLAELEAQEKQLSASRIKLAQDTAKGIIDAEKQIANIRQQGIQDNIRDVERAAKLGEKPRIDAIKETTQLQQEELAIQAEQLQKSIAKERELLSQGTGNENRLAELQAEQEKLADKRRDIAIEGEEKLRAERLAIERRTATERQAIETQAALAQAEIDEQGGATDAELQADRLEATQDRINREIEAEQRKQEILKQAPQTAENLDAIAQSENSITKLRTEASQNRKEITVNAERAALTEVQRIREQAERTLNESTAKSELAIAQAAAEAKASGAARIDIERETQRQSVQIERETSQERLQIAKDNLQRLSDLPTPLDPDDARERAKQIAAAQIEVYNATGQALRAQAAVEQNVADQAIANIERQAQARKTAADAAVSALERRRQLLQTEQDLQDSVTNLETTRLRNRARLEEDPKKRAKIELQIAQTQQKAQRERFAFEKQLLELTLQREAIENRIAQAALRGELAKAEANNATDEEKDAIRQQLADREALGNLIAQSADSRREGLSNKQKAEADTARTDVKLAAKGVADALKEAGNDIKDGGKKAKKDLEGLGRKDLTREEFNSLSVEQQQRVSKGMKVGESAEDFLKRLQGRGPKEEKIELTGIDAVEDNTKKQIEATLSVEKAIREQSELAQAQAAGMEEGTTTETPSPDALPQDARSRLERDNPGNVIRLEGDPPQTDDGAAENTSKVIEKLDEVKTAVESPGMENPAPATDAPSPDALPQDARSRIERDNPGNVVKLEGDPPQTDDGAAENAAKVMEKLDEVKTAVEKPEEEKPTTNDATTTENQQRVAEPSEIGEQRQLQGVVEGIGADVNAILQIAEADSAALTVEAEQPQAEQPSQAQDELRQAITENKAALDNVANTGIEDAANLTRKIEAAQQALENSDDPSSIPILEKIIENLNTATTESLDSTGQKIEALEKAESELKTELAKLDLAENDGNDLASVVDAIEDQTTILDNAIANIPRPKQFRQGTGGEAGTPVGEGFTVGEAGGAEIVRDPSTGDTKYFNRETYLASDRPLEVYNAADTAQILRMWNAAPSKPSPSSKPNQIQTAPSLVQLFHQQAAAQGAATALPPPISPVTVSVGGGGDAAIAALAGQQQAQHREMLSKFNRLAQYGQNTASNTQAAKVELNRIRQAAQAKPNRDRSGIDFLSGVVR